MPTFWEQHYAHRTGRMTGSAIRELLKLTEQPDFISFAGGLPAPQVFPVAEVAAATKGILEEHGAQALQYGATEGYGPLRDMIASQTPSQGWEVSRDNVLITSGSQQALDLLGKIFLNPGDRILVESPTYLGALQAWNAYEAEYIAVPTDEQGMITASLEAALQAGPKFIYVVPNFQNPTGVTLALDRRQRLVELADRYGVPIIEDDPYGRLRFEGEHVASLALLDGQRRDRSDKGYRGKVIHLSTFSKILAPGLRVAWIVAAPEVIGKLALAKQGADLHTATLNQMIVQKVANTGFLDRHVHLIRQVYRERRDTMLAALECHFPPEVRWTRPAGGMFLWVTLPSGVDAGTVLPAAVARKVSFVPGSSFHPCGGGANTLRLNFSNATPEKINEGIAQLGLVLQAKLGAPVP